MSKTPFSTFAFDDVFDTQYEYRRRKELEMEAMKYMTYEDIKRAQDSMARNDFLFKSPKQAYAPGLDYRRLASELGHRNQRFRGIGPDAVQELVELIQEIIPPAKGKDYVHVAGYDYEDLFHQACQALELAYDGEDVEGDAAEMLNLWNKILTQAETKY